MAPLVPPSDYPASLDGAYLDTASDGLVHARVLEESAAFLRDASAGRPGAGELRARAYERPRTPLARLLGASPEEIAVTHTATEALGQVAWGLSLTPDANVVSLAGEFPTVTYPWLRLGVELRLAGTTTPDALAELVDGQTAAIAVSHVQFATGALLPLADLAELARAHGALLVVDAAQSAGAVPIDVERDGVDVLVGTAGKWLCGELGAGFAYVRAGLVERIEPPLAGWRSTVEPWALDGTRIELASSARRLELSSASYLARNALGAAVELLLETGIERVAAHDARLASLLLERLDGLGAEIATPRDSARRAGIVAASFAGRDSGALRAALAADGVHVSARGGRLRFSTHLYNDEEDVDRASASLRRALGN